MKGSVRIGRILFHPSTLAICSGLFGALIAFLINLLTGGNTSSLIWIALAFTILFSLCISAWQVYSQEKTGQRWMTMLQEMVFQTYFFTLLTDKPEISQIAQQRLGQVLQNLNDDQRVSMVKFFSSNGLPARFVGDALQGSDSLAGAELPQVQLPHIRLARANLRQVNFRDADLSESDLSETRLFRADLSGANLTRASLTKADLRGIDLRGANLTGADLSDARMQMEKGARDSPKVQIGAFFYPALRANLSHALLNQAKLREANLTGADLSGAQLRGADLTKANLSYANLEGADLTGATLAGAIVVGAQLSGANLSGATLTEAALIEANLRETDLSGATLSRAILDGADVHGAKVTQEQLQTVVSKKNLKQ